MYEVRKIQTLRNTYETYRRKWFMLVNIYRDTSTHMV